MDWFPDEPEVPDSDRAEGDSPLRYEDVSQDGRLMLLALPHTIGDIVWRRVLLHHPLAKLGHLGITPILTRFVIEGGGGPVGIGRPMTARGRYQLSHTVDANGQLDRILFNMWTAARAPRGRAAHNAGGAPPAGAGEPVHVGRVFAEHVVTRLFAPPAQRKVLSLPAGDFSAPWQWRPLEAVLQLPPGAQPLDDALTIDPAEIAFGLNHTDSNQHVNSLVYPRLFQEAALRRFAAQGKNTTVLARRLEIAYRKPCFAGQRARIVLRAWQDAAGLGAAGAFVSDEAPLERPHCVIQMRFA